MDCRHSVVLFSTCTYSLSCHCANQSILEQNVELQCVGYLSERRRPCEGIWPTFDQVKCMLLWHVVTRMCHFTKQFFNFYDAGLDYKYYEIKTVQIPVLHHRERRKLIWIDAYWIILTHLNVISGRSCLCYLRRKAWAPGKIHPRPSIMYNCEC